MNNDLTAKLTTLKERLKTAEIEKEIAAIAAKSADPQFWQDQEAAGVVMKKMTALQKRLDRISAIEAAIKDQKDDSAAKLLKELELEVFLSGPHDGKEAILTIHAGQGGVEAMDWAQMLWRMYQKYLENKAWPFQVLDLGAGEEAGIKNVTLAVNEPFAYGRLKYEAGTHRLVRLSPFNADKLRQTSFALVEVLPKISATEINVDLGDLEWQFFHSSSQGGQNVQKVSTAVRLKHRPSGLIVTCQTERFQEQNRRIALELLQARLWEKKEAERASQINQLKKGRTQASWGTQIRSYVLHPYKMVKDLRTKYESGHPESILAGDLDQFIDSEIRFLSPAQRV